MRVEVRGYQILKNAVMDIDGITMVVGSNNHGKSSMVRAIESCLFNPSGEEFINDEADTVAVEVSFDQEQKRPPLKVKWQKPRKGGATYTINNEEFRKLGRSTPEALLKEHGIREVQVRDGKERLFFWRQNEPMFMITANPSYIFDFLSTLMEEKKLIPVLKKMAADGKQVQTNLISIEGSIQMGEKNATILIGKEAKLAKVEELKDSVLELLRRKVAFERMSTAAESIEAISKQTEQAGNELQGLNSMRLPDLTDMGKRVAVWSVLASSLASADVAGTQIEEEERRLGKIEDVAEIAHYLGETEPEIRRLSELSVISEQVGALQEKIHLGEDGLEAAIKEHGLALTEFEVFKREIGVCPTCGRGWGDGEHPDCGKV